MSSLATRLSPLDLALVALYLVGITIFGLRFSRHSGAAAQSRSLKGYFLADNTVPWWAIALSIVSAETSTLTIISIPGVAFAGNLGFLQVVLGYLLGRVVVALLFLPRYFRGEMLTAYQLIDRRFGPVLHKVTAGLFLLTRAAAEGVRVFAISIVVGIAIGTGDVLSIAIISALTLLYTFEGGMAAVIWTDVVQMILYVAGTVVAIFSLGAHVPGGWQHIHAVAAPLGKFHWLDFTLDLTTAYTFWAGLLGGTFLTMASHGTDQLMVQRMLAARSLRESRWALLSSGAVILVQFFLFLLIGVGLFVFYQQHPVHFASADRIFPTFIVTEMPHGVAGLLVAAILAAAMSNLSAALNSLASTSVVDFLVPLRSRSAQQATLLSRVATVFWALVLFAIAVYSIRVGGKGHVVETGLSIASVAYGCLLGVFLLGTLLPAHLRYSPTQQGVIPGMILGFALNVYLWKFTHVAFTWYVLIGAAVTFVLGALFSALLPRPRRAATLALLLAAVFAATAGAQSTPDFSAASTLIEESISARRLPGAVLLVGHDGHVVFQQAYGVRRQAGEPGPFAYTARTPGPAVQAADNASAAELMTQDTLFDMASLSKLLATTTSVLQLVDQHKLALDTPVAHYLPAFAANGKQAITVRELMTHYSGLAEDVSLADAWGLAAPDKAEGIRRAMNAVPYGPPGLTFKYSDINFITLGALVESITGQTLDAYARTHVFAPLGMVHTGYHPYSSTCGPALRIGAAVYPGPKPIGRIGMVCLPGTWSPYALDPTTAPTQHDEQGTPSTNPDFGNLLRGTVHDPTTRRMGGVAGHAGVFSTAADVALFAQALLDRLLDNTGPFPVSQATLRLATSPQQPATAQGGATIFLPNATPAKGIALRGLGWDINSGFSRPRGAVFPTIQPGQPYDPAHPPSFGHTGFTGTSLWIDPASRTYVILLSNAGHPRGGAPVTPLRAAVATAVARSLGLPAPTAESSPASPAPAPQ